MSLTSSTRTMPSEFQERRLRFLIHTAATALSTETIQPITEIVFINVDYKENIYRGRLRQTTVSQPSRERWMCFFVPQSIDNRLDDVNQCFLSETGTIAIMKSHSKYGFVVERLNPLEFVTQYPLWIEALQLKLSSYPLSSPATA